MSYTVIFYSTLNYGLASLGESFLNPNLLCLANFCSKFSLLGPRPQLALFGEFLLEILFVGAPTPTCFAW
ncbi:hypothetical protein B7467_02280 [Staphylococcus lugdunensis]|nr:hypothetical protein B7467_02280 [Staphylococcus lugdunensis]